MAGQRSSFFERVYAIVARIPAGSVATYGQIAMFAGNPRAARVVGYAMHGAPAGRNLPCHRVVNRAGALSPPEIFGDGVQRALLEREGVAFLENGRIDLKRHLWRGTELL